MALGSNTFNALKKVATGSVTDPLHQPQQIADYIKASGGDEANALKQLDGTSAANAKAAKATAAQKDALASFQNLQTPNVGNVSLAKQVDQGGYKSAVSNYSPVGNTAYNDISANPDYSVAKDQSLGSLDSIISGGGLTDADRANIQSDRTANSTADRGRREAILQNAQASGMAGGGNQLLAQLSSSQAATNANNQNDLTVQGQAQQNALSAIQNKGNLANTYQTADYDQANKVASASDSLNQFNASNSLQNNQFNAAAKTQQNASNTANSQAISNANKNITNQQTMQNDVYNPQQNYANTLAKTQGTAGQQANLGNFYQGQANQQNIQNGQILGGAAQVGAAALSDKNAKTDIKPLKDDEIDEFLSAVQPKKFKYKDPSTPLTAPGQRDGFLAQDVANTKLGQDVVKPTDDGQLGFDKDNLQGVMLAALAKMHKEKK